MASNNPYSLSRGRYSTHSVLSKLIGENNDVLDIGCNEGYLGSICAPSNRFSGIEMMSDAAEKARATYRQVVQGDLDELRAIDLDATFDVLVFADVLEHLKKPAETLQLSCERWLKPGGRVVLSLPNIANWQVRLNLLFGKFEYQETGILDKTHLHFYTFKSAAELMTGSGLKPSRILSGATFFGPLIAMAPFARGLLATNIVIAAGK